jgi:hypothetical protein
LLQQNCSYKDKDKDKYKDNINKQVYKWQ